MRNWRWYGGGAAMLTLGLAAALPGVAAAQDAAAVRAGLAQFFERLDFDLAGLSVSDAGGARIDVSVPDIPIEIGTATLHLGHIGLSLFPVGADAYDFQFVLPRRGDITDNDDVVGSWTVNQAAITGRWLVPAQSFEALDLRVDGLRLVDTDNQGELTIGTLALQIAKSGGDADGEDSETVLTIADLHAGNAVSTWVQLGRVVLTSSVRTLRPAAWLALRERSGATPLSDAPWEAYDGPHEYITDLLVTSWPLFEDWSFAVSLEDLAVESIGVRQLDRLDFRIAIDDADRSRASLSITSKVMGGEAVLPPDLPQQFAGFVPTRGELAISLRSIPLDDLMRLVGGVLAAPVERDDAVAGLIGIGAYGLLAEANTALRLSRLRVEAPDALASAEGELEVEPTAAFLSEGGVEIVLVGLEAVAGLLDQLNGEQPVPPELQYLTLLGEPAAIGNRPGRRYTVTLHPDASVDVNGVPAEQVIEELELDRW